jgi:hypothetical protein
MTSSAGAEISFRRYGPEDAEQTLAIMTQAYGRWPNFDVPVEPLEHLRWQTESPDAGATANYVALVGSEIASIHLGYARRVWLKGETRLLWFGCDSATGPAFQGQGLFGRLRAYRVAESSQSFDMMATNPVNATVAYEFTRDPRAVRLGNEVRSYQRVLDGGRLAAISGGSGLRGQRVFRRVAYSSMYWLGAVRSLLTRLPAAGWDIYRIDRFDERIDAFWEEARRAFDFVMERRREFLNWRYRDPRGGLCTVLVAEEGGRILGYTVLRMSGGRGHVADLLALPGREDVAASLIAAAVEHFKREGAAAVRFWKVKSHPYNKLLSRAGFFYTRQRMLFFFLAMRTSPEQLAFLERTDASVHLTDGDMV